MHSDTQKSKDDMLEDFDDFDNEKNNYINEPDLFNENTGEKYADLLKDLMEFDEPIRKIYYKWLGLAWDNDTEEFKEIPEVEPKMNRKGAEWSLTFLMTYARKSNYVTNITEDEFKDFKDDIIEVVWTNIGCRAEEFEIKNDGDILTICTQLEHIALLVLTGAWNGKYNQLLNSTINQNYSMTGNPNAAKRNKLQELGGKLFGI